MQIAIISCNNEPEFLMTSIIMAHCIIIDDESYCVIDCYQLPGRNFYKSSWSCWSFWESKIVKISHQMDGMASYFVMSTQINDIHCQSKHERFLLAWSCFNLLFKSCLNWHDANRVHLVPIAANPPNRFHLRPIVYFQSWPCNFCFS